MNVKEKVGLLGLRPASAGPESHGSAVHAPPSLAAGSSGTLGSGGTKAERQAAALQLWTKWAHDALGPMSSEPTAEELARKSSRVQRLEHECAALAARAQRRLEVSSAIRAQTILIGAGRETPSVSAGGASASAAATAVSGGFGAGRMSGSGVAVAAAPPSEVGSTGVVLRPGAFSRELQYAVRERRRASAYAAVRAEGAAEATSQAASEAAAAEAAAGLAPGFKSRAMLDALIAGRGADATSPVTSGAPPASSVSSPKAAVPRLRPHSALPLRTSSANAAGGGFGGGRLRPRSAVPAAAAAAALGRSSSMAPSTGGGPFARSASMAQRAASLAAGSVTGGGAGGSAAAGGGGGGASLISVPESEYLALRQEMTTVSERLAATQAALEVQTDTEAQLREAVDLLRARLHSSGLREVDAQRRLAQHSKLEPLFDRLAECFTFSSPEEVVARLEFLEDDKLGTFDQLLRTQEEVTRLQQRLAEAQKAGEMVATRLTTEHLQGSARLQEQNEELRQELESMQNLVHRLTSRQAQLVALQTAVLQLWGKLSDDPQFAEAFLAGSAPGAGRGSASGAARRAVSSGRTQPGHLSTHGGAGDDPAGPGGPGLQPDDPLSMLHMIEEFVTAKSNKLAIRHFTDIQRLANHVWQQHFRNRADIRGRVVPTFEQISKMADRMAGRVKSVQDQASRSQDAEKMLMKEVRRLQQQKRVLEAALARRDEQFKTVMGVPRRERPASATAELGRILRREANAAVGGMNTTGSGGAGAGGSTGAGGTGAGAATPPRQASRVMSVLSLSPSGLGRGNNRGEAQLDMSYSVTSGLSALSLRPQSALPHGQQQQQHARSSTSFKPQPHGASQRQQQQAQPSPQHPSARPASAPSSAFGGSASIASAASRLRQALQGPGLGAPSLPPSSTASGPTSNGTLAAVLSPAIALQVPQMVSDLPAGPHWRQHVGATTVNAAAAQRTAPARLPAGSLFYTAEHAAVGADPAPAGHGAGFGGDGVGAAACGPPQDADAGGAAAGSGPGASEAAPPEVPTARWSAPQRSAIEQAFLTRLERRTRVT